MHTTNNKTSFHHNTQSINNLSKRDPKRSSSKTATSDLPYLKHVCISIVLSHRRWHKMYFFILFILILINHTEEAIFHKMITVSRRFQSMEIFQTLFRIWRQVNWKLNCLKKFYIFPNHLIIAIKKGSKFNRSQSKITRCDTLWALSMVFSIQAIDVTSIELQNPIWNATAVNDFKYLIEHYQRSVIYWNVNRKHFSMIPNVWQRIHTTVVRVSVFEAVSAFRYLYSKLLEQK